MLLTPVLILAAFLMTLSFLVAPIERVVDPDLDLGGFGTNQVVAWYLLTFFPVLLFAASYRAIAGVSRLRSVALGHVFVFYGLLWVAAGFQALWRLLAGRKSWIKTDRLVEVDESAVPAAAQRSRRPAMAAAEEASGLWADWYADAERRAQEEQARQAAAAQAATDAWIAWYQRTQLLTSPSKSKDGQR